MLAVSAQVGDQAAELADVKAQLAMHKSVLQKIMTLGTTEESSTESLHSSDPSLVLEQLQKNVNLLPAETVQRIRQEASEAYPNILNLENKVRNIDHSLQNLSFKLNNMEQYSKEWNILIKGLKNLPVRPTDPVGRNAFEFNFIEHICNVLNDLLATKLYKPLHPSDIERAHILFQGSKQGNPVVIVRFVRRVVRNNVFFSRKHLKGTKVSISDHLSKYNLSLLKEAINIFGSDNTWSCLSKIYVRFGGRSHCIKTFYDIDKLAHYAHGSDSYQPPYVENPSNLDANNFPGLTVSNDITATQGNSDTVPASSTPVNSTVSIDEDEQVLKNSNKKNSATSSTQEKKLKTGRKSSIYNRNNRLNNSRLTPKIDLRYNK